MTDQFVRKTPLPPTRSTGNHIYTKLQVHHGGDVQDLVLKSEQEPNSYELAKALEDACHVPMNEQLVYFRGQRLHNHQSATNARPLSRYGIFSGNTITLVGTKGLL